ncbi:MAG: HAMP domain-containing sensor histidine kinase [Bacteriovorax sp.]|jgi:signal transduction histidine kinase
MPKELLPYSIFLVSFIFINLLIYFVIQLNAKEKVFKELFYYWLAVFFVTLSEGTVKDGKLGLSLIFLANFPAIYIMVRFILRAYNYKFNTALYLKAMPVVVALTILFDYMDASFPITSLPVILISMGPFVEALYISLFKHREESGLFEKLIGGFVSILAIGCIINYGLNRYNPTLTQYILGFGSAFVCYIIYSILLPLYCIQQINRKRTDFLEAIVSERTSELSESKVEKEKLLRVLVHDISNSLFAAIYELTKLNNSFEHGSIQNTQAEKSLKRLNAIKDIISHVREYECVLSGTRTLALEEVPVQECLDEIEQIFSHRFSAKNIRLHIYNKLSADAKIRVDKTSFIHSVASNLVSNALKFSLPDSDVVIACFEENSQIVFEFIDNGIGMSKDSLDNIFNIGVTHSRAGTLGETGTGFGLPIVKAYAMMFGGKIEATSSVDKESRGTKFALYLPSVARENFENQTYVQ